MGTKSEIRILGVDDAPHDKFNPGEQVLVIAPIFRGGKYMDGLLSTHITADGDDSTKKLVGMINKTRHKDQLSVIMTDGVAFGGFNVLDVIELHAKTQLPVITIIRKRPDFDAIAKAIKHVSNPGEKLSMMQRAGEIKEYEVTHNNLGSKQGNKVYFQTCGITEEDARKVLKVSIQRGVIPEPIRVAHLIGSGVKFGESRGRA